MTDSHKNEQGIYKVQPAAPKNPTKEILVS